jgi:hypothetical protein
VTFRPCNRVCALLILGFLALTRSSSLSAQQTPSLAFAVNVTETLENGFSFSLTSSCSQSSFNKNDGFTFSAMEMSTANSATASVSYYTSGTAPGSFFASSNGGLDVYALAPPGTTVQITGTRTGTTTVATTMGATGIAYVTGNLAETDLSGSGSNTATAPISFSGKTSGQFSCNGQTYSYVTTIPLSTYIAINNCPGGPGQTCGTSLATDSISVSSVSACPIQPIDVLIQVENNGTTMFASYTPGSGTTPMELFTKAAACGFKAFNWQQTITNLPCPSPFFPVTFASIPSANLCPSPTRNALTATPTATFLDPPAWGYLSLGAFNPFPFYYPVPWVSAPNVRDIWDPSTGAYDIPIVDPSGDVLVFSDNPGDFCLPGGNPSRCDPVPGLLDPPGSFIGFTTALVGVKQDGTVSPPLYQWTWTDSFNGTSGGVSALSSPNPVDPGSGTGGISITSVNGVPIPLAFTATSLPTAVPGTAYSQFLASQGGNPPYFWSITSGRLPAGLTLSDGTIVGTPAAASASLVTFQVADSSVPPQIANVTLPITVAQNALRVTSTSLPNGQVGVPYFQTLLTDGGVSPFIWTTADPLPGGLTLDPATGIISGTPTTAVTNSRFLVSVSDATAPLSQTATAALQLTITN